MSVSFTFRKRIIPVFNNPRLAAPATGRLLASSVYYSTVLAFHKIKLKTKI